MAQLAVMALGADRPGIIARVSGVLLEHSGNIEDSTMTILGGHFAILLLVETPSAPADLEEALVAATADLGLVVAVRPAGARARSDPPTHVLSVYGSDRPGIVHAVTRQLAEDRVNVTDLVTRVLESGTPPVYAMQLEVSVPAGLSPDDAVAHLRAVPELAGIEVSIHPLDVATF